MDWMIGPHIVMYLYSHLVNQTHHYQQDQWAQLIVLFGDLTLKEEYAHF